MCWQLLSALLLVALASAGPSVQGTEESAVNHLQGPLDEDNGTQATNEDSATTDESDASTVITTLLQNITKATLANSINSSHIQTELQSLANTLQTLALPYCVVDGERFILGNFPNPGIGVYVGINMTSWDDGSPYGGRITGVQNLEDASRLDMVVGVVVESLAPQRTVLVSSYWESNKYPTPSLEYTSIVDVFLYDAVGEEEAIQVFWQPYSVDRKGMRCEAWVPEQGWDGGRCETATFGAGMVGCRCQGASFAEGGLRRASFLVIEDSETLITRYDLRYLELISLYFHDQPVGSKKLEDTRTVLRELLFHKPELFLKPGNDTFGLLLDIGSVIHRTRLPNNDSVAVIIVHGDYRQTLVVAEGDGGSPLAGLHVGRRWPTDNPVDTTIYATGVSPGGSSLESTTDTDGFAVRIAGNVSLPRRASLHILVWPDKNFGREVLLKEAASTKRVADLVLSGEDAEFEVEGVDFVFETTYREWTKLVCFAWNFNESVWDTNACSSQNISSRHHVCTCPQSMFKIDDLLRTRIQITEESSNLQYFVDWDIFNRTAHHLGHLAQVSLPSEQLPNITALVDYGVLRKFHANDHVLPWHLLDDVALILHQLALDPNNATAFSLHKTSTTTAALFVQDGDNDSLATVAIAEEYGRIWNVTQNVVTDSIVAVSFNPPQNGVGRVALTYINATYSEHLEENITHHETVLVDASWRQSSPPPAHLEVDLVLQASEGGEPAPVRSKTCRYWVIDRRDWSEDCTISRLDDGKESCHCTIAMANHIGIVLTRFKIASDWTEKATPVTKNLT